MANLSIRGLDDDLSQLLKEDAQKHGLSINARVIELIRQGLGVANDATLGYHDLDGLAGTWDEMQAKAFLEDIADFEQIDESLWS